MAPSDILALAQQGDPQTIEAILNYTTRRHGIRTKVARQAECLHVLLESDRLLNQDAAVSFICNGLKSLNIQPIHLVRVYGRRKGETAVLWNQEVPFSTVANDPSSVTLIESPTSSASPVTQPPDFPGDRFAASPNDHAPSLEPAAVESSVVEPPPIAPSDPLIEDDFWAIENNPFSLEALEIDDPLVEEAEDVPTIAAESVETPQEADFSELEPYTAVEPNPGAIAPSELQEALNADSLEVENLEVENLEAEEIPSPEVLETSLELEADFEDELIPDSETELPLDLADELATISEADLSSSLDEPEELSEADLFFGAEDGLAIDLATDLSTSVETEPEISLEESLFPSPETELEEPLEADLFSSSEDEPAISLEAGLFSSSEDELTSDLEADLSARVETEPDISLEESLFPTPQDEPEGSLEADLFSGSQDELTDDLEAGFSNSFDEPEAILEADLFPRSENELVTDLELDLSNRFEGEPETSLEENLFPTLQAESEELLEADSPDLFTEEPEMRQEAELFFGSEDEAESSLESDFFSSSEAELAINVEANQPDSFDELTDDLEAVLSVNSDNLEMSQEESLFPDLKEESEEPLESDLPANFADELETISEEPLSANLEDATLETDLFASPEDELINTLEAELLATEPEASLEISERESVQSNFSVGAVPSELHEALIATPHSIPQVSQSESVQPVGGSLEIAQRTNHSDSEMADWLKRPEALIMVLFVSLIMLWQMYIELLEDLPEGAITGRQLADRLGVSSSAISRRKRREDFSAWSQSLDPAGIAWTYVGGVFMPSDALK